MGRLLWPWCSFGYEIIVTSRYNSQKELPSVAALFFASLPFGSAALATDAVPVAENRVGVAKWVAPGKKVPLSALRVPL